jgi:putative two-component system response regulator
MITTEQILNARIVVVEDDKASRVLLEEILRAAGFKSIRSLSDAETLVKGYTHLDPDLVILDLNLPRMNGFEVMNRLKVQFADDYLPILVITGDLDDSIHLRALSSGAKDFLNKPYDRAKVLLRCRNLIETKLLHREVMIKNADLEQVVHDRTEELERTRLDVIRRLGFASEYRDTDTGVHIVRMSRYCEALARVMGMSEEECNLVLNTSPLHDVGKIAIPDSILLKAEKLNPEEWEVMKRHAEIGGAMLSEGDSAFLKMAEEIAWTHHERWDGKGYPRGLKGEDIPLVGRVVAVCDVFDALTSERPYKKAWTFEAAVKEIRRMSGTSFDPRIVDAFISILPQIKRIKEDAERLPQRSKRDIRPKSAW